MKCEEVPLLEFLKAELDAEQTELVLRHTEQCPACQERVHVLAALAASYPAEPQKLRRESGVLRRSWLLAAALVVALLAPVVYYQMQGTAPADLATDVPYPAGFPLVTRDRPLSHEDEIRRQADQAYTEGDYRAAEGLYAQLPRQPDISFYIGVSQYFQKEYPEALTSLRLAARDSLWETPAIWFIASAQLRLGETDEARKNLMKLVQRKDEYGDKAADLLDKLSSAGD